MRRFPIDGGLLRLDGASNCLFAYNDTARHVWDLIEDGRTEESLTPLPVRGGFHSLWRARTSMQSLPSGDCRTSWSIAAEAEAARSG